MKRKGLLSTFTASPSPKEMKVKWKTRGGKDTRKKKAKLCEKGRRLMLTSVTRGFFFMSRWRCLFWRRKWIRWNETAESQVSVVECEYEWFFRFFSFIPLTISIHAFPCSDLVFSWGASCSWYCSPILNVPDVWRRIKRQDACSFPCAITRCSFPQCPVESAFERKTHSYFLVLCHFCVVLISNDPKLATRCSRDR